MDFGFSEEQEQLRSTVRDFLAKEAPLSRTRAIMEDPACGADQTWSAMAQLGWLGLTVPERYGGSGLGYVELVLVMEEMGAVVLPGPFWATACLGVPAVMACGSDAQKEQLLGAVAAGSCHLTVAAAEETGCWSGQAIRMEAKTAKGGYTLRGTKLFVPDAGVADSILVVARLPEGFGLFELPAGASGLGVTSMVTVDRTRRLDVVELSDAFVPAAGLLGGQAIDEGTLNGLFDTAKVALSAEMCGAAETALSLSVDYAGVREQFGRLIGSFQAIQHKLADMKVLLENARSLVYYAASCFDQQETDRQLAAAMAKAYASEACSRVAADAIQVHGGIGFTWEHDLHLFLKRIKASEVSYGDAAANHEQVAELLGL